jgi:hypothetical protein
MFRCCLIVCTLLLSICGVSNASCPVDTIIIKGRVDSAPRNASVHVQLVYANNKPGESAEATVQDDETFSVPLEFVTQSRGPIVDGIGGKCERRPQSVLISFMRDGGEKAADEISLIFPRDFKMVDASAYASRSQIVLNRPR